MVSLAVSLNHLTKRFVSFDIDPNAFNRKARLMGRPFQRRITRHNPGRAFVRRITNALGLTRGFYRGPKIENSATCLSLRNRN